MLVAKKQKKKWFAKPFLLISRQRQCESSSGSEVVLIFSRKLVDIMEHWGLTKGRNSFKKISAALTMDYFFHYTWMTISRRGVGFMFTPVPPFPLFSVQMGLKSCQNDYKVHRVFFRTDYQLILVPRTACCIWQDLMVTYNMTSAHLQRVLTSALSCSFRFSLLPIIGLPVPVGRSSSEMYVFEELRQTIFDHLDEFRLALCRNYWSLPVIFHASDGHSEEMLACFKKEHWYHCSKHILFLCFFAHLHICK